MDRIRRRCSSPKTSIVNPGRTPQWVFATHPPDQVTHGYAAAADPTYFLTVVDRGADALVPDCVLGVPAAEALKAEARRRADEGIFFGSMSYVCLIATKS